MTAEAAATAKTENCSMTNMTKQRIVPRLTVWPDRDDDDEDEGNDIVNNNAMTR